jgi:hypothetical protein
MYPKSLVLVNKCKMHKISISVMQAVKGIFIQTSMYFCALYKPTFGVKQT